MKIKNLFISAIALGSVLSCVTPDDYGVPAETCVDLTATLTVAALNAATTNAYQQYTNDDIMEAYVTSSDEGGNFYKSITFVSLDGLQGFSIPVDQYNLYTEFEPGRKVFVNMKNRYFVRDSNATKIGSLFNNGTPANLTDDTVGRISIVDYKNVLTRSCTKVNEDDLVNHITIAQAKNNNYINKLIEFDMVQFSDPSVGQNYYDTDVFTIGGGTNHELVDALGNTITLRVSEFAKFAAEPVPSGNGKVRGVLTKFGSTFQFMIRTENDVKLAGNRVVKSFLTTVNEPFTSYTANATGFANYYNVATAGSYLWQVKNFSGNNYIQMTANNSGGPNRALFVVPVDFNSVTNMSFKTNDGYNNGAVLKVYYSLNYNPGNPNAATLTDITSSFTISSGHPSGYGPGFVNSGSYTFPALTGDGYIVFEYVGNGTGVKTTMQIDDIAIN